MENRATTVSRPAQWWLGGCHPKQECFLDEEFADLRKATRTIMLISGVLFLLRGSLEWFSQNGPSLGAEALFRIVGSSIILAIGYFYSEQRSFRAQAGMLFSYILFFATSTAMWVPLRGMHPGYIMVPLVLLLVIGALLWPRLKGIYWPFLAVLVPAWLMLAHTHAPAKDWAIFTFYMSVGGILGTILRRLRLRSSFALFLMRETLHSQATRDPLTHLLNRAGWEESAQPLMARTLASGFPVSLLFFDIDHFKQVNDKHGHDVGDHVLVHTAKVLSQGLRKDDIMARLGGEEFVAMLPGADEKTAFEVADRLRQAIQSSKSPVPITISVGLAQATMNKGLHRTMTEADTALYEAKRSGRNRVVLASA